MRLSLRSLLFGAVVALLAVVSFWGAEPLGLWRYALLCFAVALLFEWWQVQNAELNLELEPKGVARLGLPVEIGVRLHGEQALTTRHRLIGNGAVRAPAEDGALVLARGAHTQAATWRRALRRGSAARHSRAVVGDRRRLRPRPLAPARIR